MEPMSSDVPDADGGGDRGSERGEPPADPRISAVEAAVASLDDLESEPVDRHAARFHALHRTLQQALAEGPSAGEPSSASRADDQPPPGGSPP